MKALMKTIILALFLLTGISYGQDSTQLSQITLLGIPPGSSIPMVRMLVQTEWTGGAYYGWEFVSNANDEYTAFTWFYGAPAIAGRSNINISQHNFNIRADLVLRTYVEYPEPTVAIVYAYAGTSEGTLIEIGNIEVHDGVGVIAKDGFPADGNVPFFAFGGGRRPGMLFHENVGGATERPLFKLFKDGYPFGSDEADMYVGTFDTPLATYDTLYRDARDGYYVQHLLLNGDGSVKMDGNYNGGFSYYREDPLPVELTSFTSKYLTDKIQLNWVTKTEVNNYGFNVERRINESEWNTIGFVEGHGNSNSPNEYSYADKDLFAGGSIFQYRLTQIDTDGQFEYSNVVEVELVSIQFELSQNYPNPFNPTTTIRFSLPHASQIKINLYNVIGELVATLAEGMYETGNHKVTFDAGSATSELPSGTYIFRFISDSFIQSKKMILLK